MPSSPSTEPTLLGVITEAVTQLPNEVFRDVATFGTIAGVGMGVLGVLKVGLGLDPQMVASTLAAQAGYVAMHVGVAGVLAGTVAGGVSAVAQVAGLADRLIQRRKERALGEVAIGEPTIDEPAPETRRGIKL